MITRRLIVTFVIVGMLALPGPWAHGAEQVASLATQADLDDAIAKTLDQEVAARTTITTLLQRPEVRKLAEGRGLDVRRAEAAVGTLQGDELRRLSALAANADAQLAGGSHTVRISLVALLLIIIIVILIAK